MIGIKITDFYDEFRPYNESEAKEAIKRLSENQRFFELLKFFLKDLDKNKFLELISSISSIKDFQENVLQKVLNVIIKNSTEGFTYSGLENISPDNNYVFISNHRDIILDATLFQSMLSTNSIDTTEITFGNNLMNDPLVYDLGKINKMFKVYRKGTPKELLKKTMQLSEYIRYTIATKKRSVWLAQRGGRTKNGCDKTQTGIIKMLNASGTSSLELNLKTLNIIPLTISYEYEPNDHLKVNELINTVNGKYVKAENEDINSIIDGVQKQKGRIHLNVGETINSKLNSIQNISGRNKQISEVAKIIDHEIHKHYKLWPNNYIAFDLLNNSAKFSDMYSHDEKENFEKYMNIQLEKIGKNIKEGKKLFLKIYTNPVINKMRFSNECS